MLAGNIPAFFVNESLTNCIQIVYMMYPKCIHSVATWYTIGRPEIIVL